MNNTNPYHIPVLCQESIDALGVDKNPDGIFVDLTFGGGGHARAILNELGANGRLIAFDQDPDAIAEGEKIKDQRLILCHANFRYFRYFLDYYQIVQVDGIFADLGTSSHQLNTASRGFAARLEAPLDMRMGQSGRTAADLINQLKPNELSEILTSFGELRNARRVTDAIVHARKRKKITEVEQLKKIVTPYMPFRREHQFLAKLFQALRIAVNEELIVLEEMLHQIPLALRSGGRAVILAYHSLEDRLVKRYFRDGNVNGVVEKDEMGAIIRPLNPLYKKAVKASKEEVADNSRARSVRLRAATTSR